MEQRTEPGPRLALQTASQKNRSKNFEEGDICLCVLIQEVKFENFYRRIHTLINFNVLIFYRLQMYFFSVKCMSKHRLYIRQGSIEI